MVQRPKTPLKVKIDEKKETVSLTFTSEGWTDIDTQLAELMGKKYWYRIASFVADALESQARCESIELHGNDRGIDQVKEIFKARAQSSEVSHQDPFDSSQPSEP